jgi:hypothetical protein
VDTLYIMEDFEVSGVPLAAHPELVAALAQIKQATTLTSASSNDARRMHQGLRGNSLHPDCTSTALSVLVIWAAGFTQYRSRRSATSISPRWLLPGESVPVLVHYPRNT